MGREIVSDEAAQIAGVARDTFLAYVHRNQAPAPVRRVGRTPVWDEDEIREWMANRPGTGSRSTARARSRAAERRDQGDVPPDAASGGRE